MWSLLRSEGGILQLFITEDLLLSTLHIESGWLLLKMFGLGKMLQSCGSGCRLLWNDPGKQTEGYGTVSKDDGGQESDDPFEFDDEPDLIFTQPYPKTIWSDNTMHSPIVKNVTVSANGSTSTAASSMFNSPIVKKIGPCGQRHFTQWNPSPHFLPKTLAHRAKFYRTTFT